MVELSAWIVDKVIDQEVGDWSKCARWRKELEGMKMEFEYFNPQYRHATSPSNHHVRISFAAAILTAL